MSNTRRVAREVTRSRVEERWQRPSRQRRSRWAAWVAPRRAGSRRRRLTPEQDAWFALATGVLGVSMAFVAPLAWITGARARRTISVDAHPRTVRAARWGHLLGRTVTVVTGVVVVLWLSASVTLNVEGSL